MSQIYNVNGGGAGVAVLTLTGDNPVPVGPLLGNINIVGAGGATVVGNAVTNTLTITAASAGIPWTEILAAALPLVADNGYICNRATIITATLPVAAAVGTIIALVGKGAGLYTIAQRAGQTIHFDDQDTTTGVGGSLTATNRYDCIELICTVADLDFTVRSSVGNFTVV
jgi:hypothetical protein